MRRLLQHQSHITAAGASRPIIRTYTAAYARYFSTEATPDPGKHAAALPPPISR